AVRAPSRRPDWRPIGKIAAVVLGALILPVGGYYGATYLQSLREDGKAPPAAPPKSPKDLAPPAGPGEAKRKADTRPATVKPTYEDAARKPGDSFRDCEQCPEMIVVPRGTFVMGSPEAEYGHSANETPEHRVTIPRNLGVGKHEVTVSQYVEFLNAA